jgi:hypothetical protein
LIALNNADLEMPTSSAAFVSDNMLFPYYVLSCTWLIKVNVNHINQFYNDVKVINHCLMS